MNDEEFSRSCPKCGKFEFTPDYLDKCNIKPSDTFDCPVCGTLLTYFILCKIEDGTEDYVAVFEDAEVI